MYSSHVFIHEHHGMIIDQHQTAFLTPELQPFEKSGLIARVEKFSLILTQILPLRWLDVNIFAGVAELILILVILLNFFF